MKKILNILLICSLLGVSQTSVIAKNKKEKVKNSDKIEIVKPEKQKVNKRQEKTKTEIKEHARIDSSKEAKGMYETKFPAITSQIEYSEMNGEVTLNDCIKLAITHHPSIVSAISNSEIYKTRIGQAWSNYFPTIGAGLSYSRNDMLNTMGGDHLDI